MWRSEPQIQVEVILIIASLGCSILGSGTCSMSTLEGPLYTTARIEPPFVLDHGRPPPIHGTSYPSYRLLCQVLQFFPLAFFENQYKLFIRYTGYPFTTLITRRR